MNPLPQRTSSAAWVRGIAELFAAEGLPVQALCAQADIDLESLQHPHTRVDVDRVSRLWEAAAQHYDRPGLGLDRQLAARYGKLDLVGHALASGPNLLEGFKHLDPHMALISDATTFSMERDPRGYWLALNHIGASRPIPRQRVSFQQLLDDTRSELARQYLADPRRSLAEVADQLGFSDQSNLFRACKRWFGMPPGQYRQQLVQPAPSAAFLAAAASR